MGFLKQRKQGNNLNFLKQRKQGKARQGKEKTKELGIFQLVYRIFITHLNSNFYNNDMRRVLS